MPLQRCQRDDASATLERDPRELASIWLVVQIAPVRNEIAHVREIDPDRLLRASVACADVVDTLRVLKCERTPRMAEDLIVADPQILGGKPCVRGTRLSVEFLLELAASGATQEQILAQYPQLTPEGLAAAFRYAAEALKGENTWALKIRA